MDYPHSAVRFYFYKACNVIVLKMNIVQRLFLFYALILSVKRL
ncbi:hypothetical protein UUU_21980 [Klebsiella pneumoniae subsp. pneumoniae DSM 30104 = JCM 1662 = NBRC 14940]|nr:hypothetical protein UUU_21980 [Klebsiella pneumoniae subsp. pneumoniae DSM 30104 = JCM 1662 = NBRC 14940]